MSKYSATGLVPQLCPFCGEPQLEPGTDNGRCKNGHDWHPLTTERWPVSCEACPEKSCPRLCDAPAGQGCVIGVQWGVPESKRGMCEWPQKDAAEKALDDIAALCGCPEWEYPGQVVRDVQAVIDARRRDSLPGCVGEDLPAPLLGLAILDDGEAS